ncbi:MAG: tetraacyldisaccharide 4'-kinase [Bacteroidales bacterium]|nr:tetraacyldisaccharide 4'-kinase [Bacteroidales bacterium]
MEIRKPSFLRFLLLGPISLIYGLITGIRNFMYQNGLLKSHEYDLPIISVGNICVGGTGKTPHVEYVVRLLKGEMKVAVLSRGYKRKSKGFRIVEADDSYTLSGDEPLQIKRKFQDIIVAVCESRTKGVEMLRKLYPELNVIILDDAFQHRKITPGLHILLNNYNFPISKDHLLPLGRLREAKHNSQRAHILVCSNCPPKLSPIERRIMIKESDVMPYQSLFFTTVVYKNLVALNGGNQMDFDSINNFNILAVTGIAHPESFVETLKSKAKKVVHIAYGDHHNFSKDEIKHIEKTFNRLEGPKIIVVTEKDAVRLLNNKYFCDEVKEHIYYAPIEIDLLCNEEEREYFNTQIISYVRNNKRYNQLYKNPF